jgi:predicted phosphodiesterase
LRVLVLSDIHGNLHALRAVLEAARGWDEVLVLGDLVDYGPRPGEVVDELRGLGARVVRGNHDEAVGYGVDCRCGEATHWLSVWFRENVTLRLVDSGVRRYLASLPLSLELDAGPLRAVAVHAAPSNPLYAYLYPWLPEGEACRLLRRPSPRLVPRREGCPRGLYLVGHTHHQFLRVLGGAVVANPGSVGQPRDGDPRAAYMILDTDTGRVEFGRVEYDVERVIRELEALGVPEPYMGALRYMLVRASVPPRPTGGVQAGY